MIITFGINNEGSAHMPPKSYLKSLSFYKTCLLLIAVFLSGCTHKKTEKYCLPIFELSEDVYLVKVQSSPSNPACYCLVPTNGSFYERSLKCGVIFDIVCMPTVDEFYADREIWQTLRYFYPLYAGQYSIEGVVPKGTKIQPALIDKVESDWDYGYYSNTYYFTKAFINNGCFSGVYVDVTWLSEARSKE